MVFVQVGGYRGTIPFFAEIDEEDLEKVSQYTWNKNVQRTTYARTRVDNNWVHMHRVIMGLGLFKDDKRIVDHKDGNGLNNKKDNLVICDVLYNSQSFRRHHGHKNVGCVSLDKSMNRRKIWTAQVILNKIRHQKRFVTQEDAKLWLLSTLDFHVPKQR